MTARLLPALAILAVIALLAAPRPAQVIPSGATSPMGSGGSPSSDPERTGAPSEPWVPLAADTATGSPAAMTTAPPTSGTIEPATARNPRLTPPPEGIVGQATWWDTFGSGLYAAIRPDLGRKGQLAVVCGGSPFHCLTVPIITTCACLGPGSGRLIDLSADAFVSFAPLSRGVIHVTLQVLP